MYTTVLLVDQSTKRLVKSFLVQQTWTKKQSLQNEIFQKCQSIHLDLRHIHILHLGIQQFYHTQVWSNGNKEFCAVFNYRATCGLCCKYWTVRWLPWHSRLCNFPTSQPLHPTMPTYGLGYIGLSCPLCQFSFNTANTVRHTPIDLAPAAIITPL